MALEYEYDGDEQAARVSAELLLFWEDLAKRQDAEKSKRDRQGDEEFLHCMQSMLEYEGPQRVYEGPQPDPPEYPDYPDNGAEDDDYDPDGWC